MSESEEPNPTGSPLSSAKSVLESVLGLVEKRFELAAVEFQEEKHRMVEQLVRLAVVGVLGLMSLFVASIFVIVVTWDTAARLYVIFGLAVAYGLATWRGFAALRRVVEESPDPFSATVEELRKDREWFQKKN